MSRKNIFVLCVYLYSLIIILGISLMLPKCNFTIHPRYCSSTYNYQKFNPLTPFWLKSSVELYEPSVVSSDSIFYVFYPLKLHDTYFYSPGSIQRPLQQSVHIVLTISLHLRKQNLELVDIVSVNLHYFCYRFMLFCSIIFQLQMKRMYSFC